MISCEVRVSRLPVGSSASSTAGWLMSARASATRCCCPPESWLGVLCSAVRQADAGQHLAAAVVSFLRGQRRGRAVKQRQHDILQRAGAGQQIEVLEHEADAPAADVGQLRFGQMRHVAALKDVLAAGRPVEAADDVHQGRLARPGRSHDGDEFAAIDGNADPLQRMNLGIAELEGSVRSMRLTTGSAMSVAL